MTEQATDPVQEVLSRLHGVSKSGSGWEAFCPAHDDKNKKSLTVAGAEDGRVLVNCFVGCTFIEIMSALGLEAKNAFPRPIKDKSNPRRRRYSVRDKNGREVAVHHREGDGKDKKIWWTSPDGKKDLGGTKTEALPLWGSEAVGSVSPGNPVILVEGEKAAFALTYRGIPAVGTTTGSKGTPTTESLECLRDRDVVLWPDADDGGLQHMRRVGKLLDSLANSVRWYTWDDAPEKGDAADHPAVLRNDGLAELLETLRHAPRFLPPHDPKLDGAGSFAYAEPPYAELRALRRKHGGVVGIRLGIPNVDANTHGWMNGYSYLIAARPNVGKSLVVGMAALQAAMQNYRVLLQTPEMSAVQYLDRFACYVAGVDYFKAQDGKTTDEEESRLDGAANMLGKLPLLVDDVGGQTVDRIRENIDRHEPELVVIDYLQYLQPNDSRAQRNQQVGQVSRDLSAIKADYNIPLLIAAQLNRASENREDNEPRLSDIRDSGELEQDADMVMMVHRPGMHDDEVDEESVRLLCRKNRAGQLWNANLYFEQGQQWLTDKKPEPLSPEPDNNPVDDTPFE